MNLTKFTSRKFLVAVAGVISGIVLIANGSTNEGVTTIVASVVAYLAAEGLIDFAGVKNKAAGQIAASGENQGSDECNNAAAAEAAGPEAFPGYEVKGFTD